MKEVEDIIKAYDEAVLAGKKTALATVVHVDGSSYRRPGARMLITEDGMLTGAISGGCLEGDALKRARLAIAKAESSLFGSSKRRGVNKTSIMPLQPRPTPIWYASSSVVS